MTFPREPSPPERETPSRGMTRWAFLRTRTFRNVALLAAVYGFSAVVLALG